MSDVDWDDCQELYPSVSAQEEKTLLKQAKPKDVEQLRRAFAIKRSTPRTSQDSYSTTFRAPDGTFGDGAWLEEDNCRHCSWAPLNNSGDKLREHYAISHNYSWRKNTFKIFNWIPDGTKLPESLYEGFVKWTSNGLNAQLVKDARAAATVKWAKISPRQEKPELGVYLKRQAQRYKLQKLLPEWNKLSLAIQQDWQERAGRVYKQRDTSTTRIQIEAMNKGGESIESENEDNGQEIEAFPAFFPESSPEIDHQKGESSVPGAKDLHQRNNKKQHSKGQEGDHAESHDEEEREARHNHRHAHRRKVDERGKRRRKDKPSRKDQKSRRKTRSDHRKDGTEDRKDRHKRTAYRKALLVPKQE
ncbi:unnamed protein product [Sympodiomycopsis kandeliae]